MFGQECSLQTDKSARHAARDPLLLSLRMGNFTSSQLSFKGDPKRRVFWRRRSWKLSLHDLGCTSARNNSTESFDPIQDNSKRFNEKAVLVDYHDRQPSPVSQVDCAPSPSLPVYSHNLGNMHAETDAEAAYQDFLQQFPGTSVRLNREAVD